MNIQTVIDQHIANQEKRSYRDMGMWHISTLGYCLGEQYYSRLYGKGGEIDSRTKRVFEVGRMFEKWVVDILKEEYSKLGIYATSQKKVFDDKYKITGSMDWYAETKPLPEIKEFKTIHSRAFFYNSLPYHHHVLQVTGYHLFTFGKTKKADMSIGYISKDDLCIRECPVSLEKDNIEEIMETLNKLNTAWREKKPPPIEKDVVYDFKTGKYIMNWKSRYCKTHHLCTGDPDWKKKALSEIRKRNLELFKKRK